MRGYTGTYTTPEVNGTFNGWCGNCNVLEDPEGDSIWTTTLALTTDTIEYKFSHDTWTGQEELDSNSSCTKTTGAFTNRYAELSGDTVLPVVCWESCEACGIIGLNDIVSSNLAIFPNPVKNLLSVESTAPIQSIVVFNTEGRQVMSFSANGSTREQVNTSALPNGIYILQTRTDHTVLTKRFVIAK
ncbi:MAG: T9SS type A sorting domain-containing protein [Cryomorphaceae bacterium]